MGHLVPCIAAILMLMRVTAVSAQTTAFTYQGRLTDNGVPASGSFQMQFKLFDAISGGAQIGSTIADLPATATDGIFGVTLDFGSNALSGANRWLEIAVRHNSGESYTTLSPREQIASSPYSVRTLSAAMADDSQKLGGVNASEYVTNASVGSSFIRNDTAQQTANFNINGSGFIGTNLGVGTTAPSNTLDVNGSIRAFNAAGGNVVTETGGGTNSWAKFWVRTPAQQWSIGSSNNFNGNQLYFSNESGGGIQMAIMPNGKVGIGTTNPTRGMLEINGASGVATVGNSFYVLSSGGLFAQSPSAYGDISLYASGSIFGAALNAFSDERMKRIDGRSDATRDLATLTGIEVTDYTYIDTIARGPGKQKKVIAQQVEKVYPQAVSRTTDVVPDIYRKAAVRDGWISLATNLKKGERVRLIGMKTDAIHEVLEVAPGRFRTDFTPDSDQVFVYGREVKDFRVVDYDAIAMLNVSATQELHRRVEKQANDLAAQVAEIAALKQQLTRMAQLAEEQASLLEQAVRRPAEAIDQILSVVGLTSGGANSLQKSRCSSIDPFRSSL